MNRTLRWILLVAVAGIAVSMGLRWRRGDEAQLRRNIRRLSAHMEKSGPESALAAAAKARSVAEYFVDRPHFELSVVPYTPVSRSEINSAVFQARAYVDALSIRIHDLSVDMAPDRQSAVMALSATATARMASDVDRARRAFEIHWRREDDGWRIESIREIQTLRRISGASSLFDARHDGRGEDRPAFTRMGNEGRHS